MGTFGRIGTGSRGLVVYGEERLWGTPVPPYQYINFVSESIVNEQETLVSNAIDPSRGVKSLTTGNASVGGDVNFEQSTEGYEVLYKHALGDAVTIHRCDGGIRTQLSAAYSSGDTTLNVDDTTDFAAAAGNFDLAVVYKDANGLLAVKETTYSVKGATSFTIPDMGIDVGQGAWVFQTYDGTSAWWDDVYTHYIEAAKELPPGLSIEVGRDVAHFMHSGMRVNTLENTFANEILTGTIGFVGKQEYVGGDLVSAVSAGDTTFTISGFSTSGSVDIEDAVYWAPNGLTTLNDMTSGGTYTGSVDQHYIIEIDATGTPDTFRWSDDGGVTWTTGVSITGSAQTLADGVQVTFAATTGHAVGEAWTFRATVEHIVGFDPAGGTVQIESENEITYTGYTASTGVFTGVPASGDGAITAAHAADKPVVPQKVWQTSPIASSAIDPLTGFQGAIWLDGSAVEIMSGSVSLNNNINTDKYQLGSRYRAGLPEQRREVTGTFNIEFDDAVLYRRYLNGTYGFIEFRCVDDASGTIGSNGSDTTNDVYRQKHILLPRTKFTGDTPTIDGPEMLDQDTPFTAVRDADNNMNEMAVVFVNTINRYF